MKKKLIFRISILIIVIITITSCIHRPDLTECITTEPDGFWNGLIHGFVAPFAFIASIFGSDYTLYSPNNTGNWYDFGYLWGIGGLFGGGSKLT